MVSCLMGDSTALASAIVRCCLRINAAKAYQNAYTNAVSNGITDDIATTQAVNAMKQYYYSLFQNNLISADQYAAMMA